MEKVTVIGAGSWGTAIAFVLAENGHDCLLWARRSEQSEEITDKHTNHAYLPGIVLPENLRATSHLEEAVKHGETVIIAVPTKAIREICGQINEMDIDAKIIVHVSKGIEPDSLKRISEMIDEELAPSKKKAIVVLSGPSHAEEVVLRHPTTVTAASVDLEAARKGAGSIYEQLFPRLYQ